MTKLLIKYFIKDNENINDNDVREKYGILMGVIGIVSNVFLAALKFIIGVFSKSISITADAINNLADAASSVVTLIGFKLANKPADDEHPFGHGRFEYIASLVVSFLILFIGLELLKSSFNKVINPQEIVFSFWGLIGLILSILVKMWMAFSNRYVGKIINSQTLIAVFTDSRNDVISTISTVIVMIVAYFSDIAIDGIIGVAVAIFILYSGYGLLKDTISLLLGEPPEAEFVKEIENKILSYNLVVGVHDLIIHNYGPGRCFASVHVEVPSDVDIIEIHEIIDTIERDVSEQFKILLTIHMDPLIMDDEKINEVKSKVESIVFAYDERFTIHDFRIVDGPLIKNLIFDILVPHKYKVDSNRISNDIEYKIKQIYPDYFCIIAVDIQYVKEA